MSWTARLLLLIGWSFAGVTLFLAVFRRLSWLDYLYFFSYIKLAVTLVKYLPQVGPPSLPPSLAEMLGRALRSLTRRPGPIRPT